MTTINTVTDIYVWLDNEGHTEHLASEEVDRVVELLVDGERRPAWGADWTEYLDSSAQAFVFEVATGYDEETADDYSRRKPETRVGGAWSRCSRGD